MNKKIWNEYFSFTRRERIGILVLIVLILGIAVSPSFFSGRTLSIDAKARAQLQKDIALLSKMEKDTITFKREISRNEELLVDHESSADSSLIKLSLFEFDPNTLDRQGWKKLGLKDRTIQTIQNYLAKGGHFRKPGDLEKIYGLHRRVLQQLLPYVRIASKKTDSLYEIKYGSIDHISKESLSNVKREPVDINTADTTVLISLPGIGSKLANRIIHFRDKLGGFYVVNQVAETYGLPDSTYQKIKGYLICNQASLKKININKADMSVLKQHPYIPWPLANAIVQYRQQHGNFVTVEQLQNINLVTPEIFRKVFPYLAVE